MPVPDTLPAVPFARRHLLAIAGLGPYELVPLLAAAEACRRRLERGEPMPAVAAGCRVATLFPGRTRPAGAGFDNALRRLGATVIGLEGAGRSDSEADGGHDAGADSLSMLVGRVAAAGSLAALVVGHDQAGVPRQLSERVACPVLNGGDGGHEHPAAALACALGLQRALDRLEGRVVVLCGDFARTGAARSLLHLLNALNVRVRLVAPPALVPADLDLLGAEIHHRLDRGLAGADAVIALPLPVESAPSATGDRALAFGGGPGVSSLRDYLHLFGLSRERLAAAKPDAIVLPLDPDGAGTLADPAPAGLISAGLISAEVAAAVPLLTLGATMACVHALLNRDSGRNGR